MQCIVVKSDEFENSLPLYIFPLNPDYVAARSLRSLRSNKINNDLEVAHPQSGSSSTWFLVELEFGNDGFWGEGKTGVPGENPLGAKERTNNKLHPHMASTPGFEPAPHWWEASVLTTAPSLAPTSFGHRRCAKYQSFLKALRQRRSSGSSSDLHGSCQFL